MNKQTPLDVLGRAKKGRYFHFNRFRLVLHALYAKHLEKVAVRRLGVLVHDDESLAKTLEIRGTMGRICAATKWTATISTRYGRRHLKVRNSLVASVQICDTRFQVTDEGLTGMAGHEDVSAGT
jgi:hypothetical protein